MFDHLACQRPVRAVPFGGGAAFQIGDQARHVYDDVAVEEAGGQLYVADVRRACVFVFLLQVVHDREVVAFGLFWMHREGVRHMH